jgi:hypothetical protein
MIGFHVLLSLKHLVSVEKCIQERQFDPLKQNVKNMPGICACSNQETEVIAKASGYVDWLVKEVTEIRLHMNNFSREKYCKLSRIWNHIVRLLKPC